MLKTRGHDRSVRGAQAPADAPVSRRRRPFGVTAIIVLLVLNVAASLLAAVIVPFGWSYLPAQMRTGVAVETGLNAVQGLASLVVAFGLWRMRRWAWYGVMILTGVSLLIAIWQYFGGTPSYPDLLLNALIAFYLNQRDVQSRFSAAGGKAVPQ